MAVQHGILFLQVIQMFLFFFTYIYTNMLHLVKSW